MAQLDFAETPAVPLNPLGMDGIEFIEFETTRPLVLGGLLEKLGFHAIARHRSREVLLYRQGGMNLIVNGEPLIKPRRYAAHDSPALSAIAMRVADAGEAHRRVLSLGAWDMPTRAAAMELNIPGIHGAADSTIHFVDRYRDFSIYAVDFVPLPGIDSDPPALIDLHFFGVVQAVQSDRTADWVDFYQTLFGFTVLPETRFPGILPKGTLLQSPCGSFFIQLVEPPAGADFISWHERLLHIGFGTSDVLAATRALESRGLVFVDREPLVPSNRGALSQTYFGSVCFEIVVDAPQAER